MTKIKIEEIRRLSKIYSEVFKYYLDDINNKIGNDYNKIRMYTFFEKMSYYLGEANQILELDFIREAPEDIETFPQKARIHLEFTQYLKFICCDSDLEKTFYRSMIYEFSYEVNMCKYFIKLIRLNEQMSKENFMKKEEIQNEIRKMMFKINQKYEQIIINPYFKDSIFFKKFKYKNEIKKSLVPNDLKKITEIYWYSLCSEYKTMAELFLFLTFNYRDGFNKKKEKFPIDEIKPLIVEVNKILDSENTKNKKLNIEIDGKTLPTLISELKDKTESTRFKKNNRISEKIKKEITDKIENLQEIKIESDFKSLIYEILSYKIHACDIFCDENNIFKNTLEYYKSFYTIEIIDLIKKFFDIFYEDKSEIKFRIFCLWKIKLEYDKQGEEYLKKNNFDLLAKEKDLKKLDENFIKEYTDLSKILGNNKKVSL